MQRITPTNATIMSLLVVVSTIASVTLLGAAVGTVGAVHPSDAPDMTDEANFTVNFPSAADHYPGDQNHQGGSIEYFASGADAFAAQGAEDGVFIEFIIVHATYEGEDWIDYSACDVQNTGAFGIDRGNNNSGTNFDDDLLDHREDSQFRDDGVVVDFFEWEDGFGDPPYLAPEDAIVASQGAGSPAGPCLTLTDQPGWYRIAGFMNGTVADNGPDQQPSDGAAHVSLELHSNYLYVCECDSEAEARDELGPPPDEGGEPGPADDGSEDPTTPTATPAPSGSDDASGDDGDPDGEPGDEDPRTGDDDETGTDDGTSADGGSDDGDDTAGGGSGDDGAGDGSGDDTTAGTPSADGPGFGAVAALLALLSAALLATRRP